MDPFFHFPIFYDSEKKSVKNEIITDLEFVDLLTKENEEEENENENETQKQILRRKKISKRTTENDKREEEEKEENDEREKKEKENQETLSSSEVNKPIFYKIFQPQDEFETEKMFHEAVKYYTTNIQFLKDNQKFLKSYTPCHRYLYDISLFSSTPSTSNAEHFSSSFSLLSSSTGGADAMITDENELRMSKRRLKEIYEIMDEMFQETKSSYFLHKYGFVDFSFFQQLNQYDLVLQCLSIYNFFSPLLSVLIPIIMFLVPFFMLKIVNNQELTLESYFDTLKQIGGNQPLIRFITGIQSATNEQRFYMIMTIAFYGYSVYKSWVDCCRFHQNMKKMHLYLVTLQGYVELTLRRMRHVISHCHMLPTFQIFNQVMAKNLNHLMDLQHMISSVKPFAWNTTTFFQFGYTMKCFYQVFHNQEIRDALLYSFGFHGFFHMTETLKKRIDNHEMSFVSSFVNPKNSSSSSWDDSFTLTKEEKEKENSQHADTDSDNAQPTLIFRQSYYPGLFSPTGGSIENVKRNDVNLEKHWIITGPNASGKTTLIKSVFINLLFSQHFGCGFYESAELTPFHSLFCYLNVPDTSGRDSLFQAEARRCKQIIDYIQTHPKQYHFGIFDELYSGTNPEEATESSFCFMRFLSSFPFVKSLLTTHFIDLCSQIQNDPQASTKIDLKHMSVVKKSSSSSSPNEFPFSPFRYLYKIENGISRVKGAFVILNELNYPKELLDLYNQPDENENENDETLSKLQKKENEIEKIETEVETEVDEK